MANEFTWARNHFSTYNSLYELYENYYYGEHRQLLTDEMRKQIKKVMGGIKDNLCPIVVDSVSDRLILSGFTSDDDTANTFLADMWKSQRLESKALTLHQNIVMRGDDYVIVWPDASGEPRIYPQSRGVIAVRYEDSDEEQVIAEAVKCWKVLQPNGQYKLRVNRYWPDRVERYSSNGTVTTMPTSLKDLIPYNLDDSGEVVTNPFGRVPVFHFPNSLRPNVFGQSELVNVVPLQDLLNNAHVDLAAACEFEGFRQKWATGVEVPIDPTTGKEVEAYKIARDRIWTNPDPEAKFGQFESGDLEKILAVINDYRIEIARVSRTPVHLMMLHEGNFPSGEALKTAEAPLLTKVDKRTSFFGDTWEDIVAFCCQIKGIDPGNITAQWQNVTPHSDLDQTQVAVNKLQIGVSKKQLQRELGYDDETIEQMAQESAEDAKAAAERAMMAFNSGDGNV